MLAGCPANSPDIHGVYPSREPLPTGEGRRKERERESERERDRAYSEVNVHCRSMTEEGLPHSENVQQRVSVPLDKGVPVDCQDAQGRTPLQLAVTRMPRTMTNSLHCTWQQGQNCQFLLEHTKGSLSQRGGCSMYTRKSECTAPCSLM